VTVLNLLAQFIYLQFLDLLTTLAFLAAGVQESNPLIRLMLQSVGTPLAGLLIAKGLATALAVFCWRSNRQRLLARANVFYAVVVAWNLVALLIRAADALPA
jgi:hypothetical protein